MVYICHAERNRKERIVQTVDFCGSALLIFLLMNSSSLNFYFKHLLLIQDSSRGKGHHSTHGNQGTSGRLAFRRGKA